MSTLIRDATAADGPDLAAIYNPYIADTVVTFEYDLVTGDEMARRVLRVQSAPLPWLAAVRDGRVVGYAYATSWRARAAYRHCVEVTIYLRPDAIGGGLGKTLYGALIDRLRDQGLHVLLGCIALPNEPSVALHEKLGFEKVAHFPEVGSKFDRWVDVGFWQKTLTGR
jgi:L-amino acid N-acyltransferase YncA